MGVRAGLLLKRLRFREQMGKVLEGLTLSGMELAGMDTVVGGNLGHRFLFLEHLEHYLGFEGRGMMFLFRHNVSSETLEGLPDCLDFWSHYSSGTERSPAITQTSLLVQYSMRSPGGAVVPIRSSHWLTLASHRWDLMVRQSFVGVRHNIRILI